MEELKVKNAAHELRHFSMNLFSLLKINLENTTELERQVLAAFCFGALNAIIQREELNQPQAHAITLALLINDFKYSEKQAVAFAEDLIKATKKEHHPVMHTIIHRGIDGHLQYTENKEDELRHNIFGILNAVKNKV